MGMMNVRLKMHADHFEVLDDTHSRAQKDASTALRDASNAKGSVDTFMSMIKLTKKNPGKDRDF